MIKQGPQSASTPIQACDNDGMSSTNPFPPLQNDTFLRACLRQATDHTPMWLMRQAGRYLPEYCATRAKAGSFMGLATNVDYATEVTLQPLDRYALDASILFSDILTVPDAMGLGLSFAQGEGPKFAKVVRDLPIQQKNHLVGPWLTADSSKPQRGFTARRLDAARSHHHPSPECLGAQRRAGIRRVRTGPRACGVV